MGVREVYSTAGSIFCFSTTSDYPSGDGSSSCLVCGSGCGSCPINRGFIWIIAVSRFFFLVGRVVPLPSVARTLSSSHSASRHGPVHWGFPDQFLVPAQSPVRGLDPSAIHFPSRQPSGSRTHLPPVPSCGTSHASSSTRCQ